MAFSDPNLERAKQCAERYGGKAFSDHNELLNEMKPDAVSVCTPNVTHAPISIAAAKAGAHVLVEKPMAMSDEEAKQMIDAANEAGVYLMVGHNQRLMPPHVKAKEILESGRLGKVLTFRTSFGTRDRKAGAWTEATAGFSAKMKRRWVQWATSVFIKQT